MDDALTLLQGRRLVGVTLALHGLGERWDVEPDARQGFWLHFAGLPPLNVRGDNHATDIVWEFKPPFESVSFGRYGDIRVVQAPSTQQLGRLVRHMLVTATPVSPAGSTVGVGLLLQFDHCRLRVTNSLTEQFVIEQDHDIAPPVEPGPEPEPKVQDPESARNDQG